MEKISNIRKIELLAPGGDSDSVKAAIAAGADAVYLGLGKYNARKRAVNISTEELESLVLLAHSVGSRIYVTMNVLLTEKEIGEAFKTACELYIKGVDALIVQDPGFAYVLSKELPDMEVHASTQMTTHNSLQLPFLQKLKVSQINLSRELNHNELQKLVSASMEYNFKTEVFVHGAFCVSCSGICYMSSFMSANSGNRGMCLQPCRRGYGTKENGEKEYLLSLKDNMMLEESEALIEMNVDSLKIEGRIKGPQYVYNVVRAWRDTVDHRKVSTDVSTVFNRGFTSGYFDAKIGPSMFVDSPLDQSLVFSGQVKSYHADKKELQVEQGCNVQTGQRLSIYTGDNNFICKVLIKERKGEDRFIVEIENKLKGRIRAGQLLMLSPVDNENEKLEELIAELSEHAQKKNIHIAVEGREGEKLAIRFSHEGKSYTTESSSILSAARKAGLDEARIREQLGRLGDTYFTLGSVDVNRLDEGLFLPVKELNAMRREGIAFFQKKLPDIDYTKFQIRPTAPVSEKKLALRFNSPDDARFLPDDFDGLLFFDPAAITSGSGDIDKPNIWVPSFITDEEIDEYKELIVSGECSTVISENSGIGHFCIDHGVSWIAGPQLNTCNSFSCRAYKELSGAGGAFLSNELNVSQLKEIAPPENFSSFLTVLGPLLLMSSRQCFFLKAGLCRFGKKTKDGRCRSDCENYTAVYDEKNIPFHIVKQRGNINQVYNNSILFTPEALVDLSCNYYHLDLRDMPFKKYSFEEKITIVSFFQKILSEGFVDKKDEKKVKEILFPVTGGNYRRGFQSEEEC